MAYTNPKLDPASGVDGPVIPVTPSGGYVIYNADGTIMVIMPDGTIIYYDQYGNPLNP